MIDIYRYVLTLFSLILILGCSKSDSPCNQGFRYICLDSENLKQNPYYTKHIESLVFYSDKGDTMTLSCYQREEDVMVGADYYFVGPDCGGEIPYTYYQSKHILYNNPFVGNIGGYLQVYHHKQDNTIYFKFAGLYFKVKDSDISNPNDNSYVQKITFHNTEFTDVVWKYTSDTTLGIGYFNRELGLVHIIDKKNNKQWTLKDAK